MSHIQSILDPAGIQAARVSHLWWVMFWICAAVWGAVALAAVAAIVRGRRGSATASDTQLGRSVAVAGGISLVALIALLFQSVVTGRALAEGHSLARRLAMLQAMCALRTTSPILLGRSRRATA